MKRFVVSFLFLTILVFSIQVIAQELVLYFPFEGDGDTVKDESGKGNDGKFDNGKANRVASKDKVFGKAMEFTTKERIAVPESKSLNIDTEISFVMWVNNADEAGGIGTLPRIISRTGDQHELAMDSGNIKRGNFAYYFGGNPGWTSAMKVPPNEWHHIALTFDGKAFKIYLDGKQESEFQGGGKKNFTGITYVGSRHTGLGESYAGLLDELAIYAGVLDQKKIEEIINEGVLNQFAVEPAGKLVLTWGNIKTR
ncbi:LamG domain-containing protein [Candidatus Poribacteria bacterium]|nr:LamG domain-containing protein [Candidatus Poribacteria bacterium]